MARHSSCPNCGATVDLDARSACDRCQADLATGGGGQPVFTSEAREAGEGLGGLLHLLTTTHLAVPFVGVCPAGAFGVRSDGTVAWEQDWGWLSSGTWEDGKLLLNGREADVTSGELLSFTGGDRTSGGAS